jgi:hypothetical protein
MTMQSEHKGHRPSNNAWAQLALWIAAIVMLIAMSWAYVW